MRKTILLLVILITASYVNATEIKTANMTVKFANDSKPKSLIHNGKELLNVRYPGKGFEVCGFAFNQLRPLTIHLNKLSYDGTSLVAKKGNISITMEMAEQHDYSAILDRAK